MIVIIDGYNVIRLIEAIPSAVLISEEQRARFIQRLQGYIARKSTTIKQILVVFDGGSLRHAERFKHGAVSEIYSGFVETADDWITSHVSRSGFGEYVVVTNDRGLRKRVESYVRLVLPVQDFAQLLKQAFVSSEVQRKNKAPSALVEYELTEHFKVNVDRDSLRELMERSTRGMLSKKSDDLLEDSSRDSRSSMPSKELSRVRRVVKKL